MDLKTGFWICAIETICVDVGKYQGTVHTKISSCVWILDFE